MARSEPPPCRHCGGGYTTAWARCADNVERYEAKLTHQGRGCSERVELTARHNYPEAARRLVLAAWTEMQTT